MLKDDTWNADKSEQSRFSVILVQSGFLRPIWQIAEDHDSLVIRMLTLTHFPATGYMRKYLFEVSCKDECIIACK